MKTSTIILSTLAVVFALGFVGCKKKENPATPAKETTMKNMQMQAAKTAEDTNKTATAAASVEQTMCPVMDGNKIDKNVFVEYKGKKVYFCCADCKAKFLAEPEKYVAKLPQFAK
ncbi:MAG: YHS domain-containing protein [Sedimentisphaerales bacterium]